MVGGSSNPPAPVHLTLPFAAMSKKSDDRKNVVIVGGGGYGIGLARDLSAKLDRSKYNLTLVSARPYYIHLVAAIRFTVTSEGQIEDRAFVPYDHLFVNGNGTLVTGKVTGIEEFGKGRGGQLVLQSGDKVPYDVLVLATGATWGGPLDFPDADGDVRASLEAWRRRYAAANEIVFIGGGAVGIGKFLCTHLRLGMAKYSPPCSLETAGEVRDAFPVSTRGLCYRIGVANMPHCIGQESHYCSRR